MELLNSGGLVVQHSLEKPAFSIALSYDAVVHKVSASGVTDQDWRFEVESLTGQSLLDPSFACW